MFEIKYNLYLDNVWFDSLYGTDYYYDKSVFFLLGQDNSSSYIRF
jgi:hypothetical protein